jgi:hypothetical protein
MEIIAKKVSDLSRNSLEFAGLCTEDQAVVLTKYGHPQLVMLNIDSFNELVEQANNADMYKDLWQAEVDARQGNMLSAKAAIEELERRRKARGSYDGGKDSKPKPAVL